MINEAVIEDAIHDWLATATGVTVIISDQDGPRPDYPYCEVRIEGPFRVGDQMDELRSITNLANPAGQEVEQTLVGVRELVISVQSYTRRTVSAKAWTISTLYSAIGVLRINGTNLYRVVTPGTSAASGGPTGTGADIIDGSVHWAFVADARTARALLSSAMANLDLPSVRDAFNAAGLVVVSKENIHNISTVIESKWQGRASFDFRLRLTDSVVEKIGYVDGVIDATGTVTAGDGVGHTIKVNV